MITVGITSHFILGLPWQWSFMLGCILGALSPAVTVPAVVNLQDRQYGVAKGIPTMLLAAGGLDSALCVTGFYILMGIVFSDGDMVVTIVKGPISVLIGIVYGFVAGIFMWYIPSRDWTNTTFYRSLILLGFGITSIFGSSEVNLSGAGPLGCIITAAVAGYKWRQERKEGEPDEVSAVMALIWLVAQHFLFGLIGAAVDISKIQSRTAGLGILTLAIGLVARSIVDFTVTLGTGFNFKERVFISLAWVSKATVQAAIGGLALDRVTLVDNPDAYSLKNATDILTFSVLAILICAPTGATIITILGPKFLVKGYPANENADDVSTVKNDCQNTQVQMFDTTQVIVDLNGNSDQSLKLEQLPVSSHVTKDIPDHKIHKMANEMSKNFFPTELVTENKPVIADVDRSQLIVNLSNTESKGTDHNEGYSNAAFEHTDFNNTTHEAYQVHNVREGIITENTYL